MKAWPHQEQGISDCQLAIGMRQDTCLSCPTGGGKTFIAIELMKWMVSQGRTVAFYTPRKMLTEQMCNVLIAAGVEFGVRASGYDGWRDHGAPIQICSPMTEHRRVFQARKKSLKSEEEGRRDYKLFPADLVILDELHMQKAGMLQEIIQEHKEFGGMILGLTATPVAVSHVAPNLITCGTKEQLRSYDPPALLPAFTYACPEIDASKIKRDAKTGNFNQAELRRIYTTHIYGNVVKEFKRLNPQNAPSLTFWPGVKESIYGCEQYNEAGIPSAHMDGDDLYVDGERFKSKQSHRDEVLKRHERGDIVNIDNRWVLREGVDMPWVQHLVLAVPVGSLVAFMQIVGRVLRAHHSHKFVTVQDHGGNWWRHPSPNADVDWAAFYDMPERAVSDHHRQTQMQKKRDDKELEIPCEHCGKVLKTLSRECPVCKRWTKQRGRMVIQESGKLRRAKGDAIRVPRTYTKPDVVKRWENAYYRCKAKGKTFGQARGLFIHECCERGDGYFEPPMNLPKMPKDLMDWTRKIATVPNDKLYQASDWKGPQ